MSSAAADALPPALPPIRTTAEPVASPSPPAEKGAQEQEQEQEAEPTTPTSEESRLRAPAECPPAPRKPAWAPPRPPAVPPTPAKRRLPSSAAPSASASPRRAFYPVARDLAAVFRALPPKKRIRAG
jgi:hypothetical protein